MKQTAWHSFALPLFPGMSKQVMREEM